MKLIKHLLLALTLTLLASGAQATVLLIENFSYTAGQALTNATGGGANGWTFLTTGAGITPSQISAPGLTYLNYTGSGISNALTMGTSGQDDRKTFTVQSTGSIYAACLINVISARTNGDFFLTLTPQGPTAAMFAQIYVRLNTNDLTTIQLGTAKDTAGATAGVSYNTAKAYATNQTHLVIVKYTFNTSASSNDRIDLFVNPALGTPEPTPTIANVTSTGTDSTGIGQLVLRQGSATAAAALRVDGIRVATTWDEAAALRPPTTNLVTSVADGGGAGTLRSIIANAIDGDTIAFTNTLSGATILLTNGQITLSQSLAIDASALPSGIAINGNHGSRIFEVQSGQTVVLTALTITNGYVTGSDGGGILNSGTLTLNQCRLSRNSAGNGGGIYNDGTMTVNQSTLSGNSADIGGGIYNDDTMTVNQSTLSGNSATGYGGGIENDGDLTLDRCTVSGNSAGSGGGGIDNNGPLLANQGTFFGNSTLGGDGGAIWAGDTVTVNNCTVVGNIGLGGATAGIAQYGETPIEIANSIVAQNTYGDIGGTFSGYNNLTGGDPQLAPLGNYGGPTQTMPPLPGSPAIDAGDDIDSSEFTTDQRGFARAVGAYVDIGAVELQTPSLVVTTEADAGPGSLRQVINDVDVSATVTFAPNLSGATILLTNGQITLNKNLTIDASALPSGIAINGNRGSRIFEVQSDQTVVLTALTITDGYLTNGSGAGIYNLGTLTVNQGTLSGNSGQLGGGIYNLGTLTVNQSTLSGNSASYGGGGIYTYFGTLTVNRSTLSGNSASYGGAIFSLLITSSTILNQCTLTLNTASTLGGAVHNDFGWTFMTNCTVSANTSPFGAGVTTFGDASTETVVANCIIAGNISGDLGRIVLSNPNAFLSLGYNLIGSGAVTNFTASGDMTNQTAATIKLSPLGNYGGPTRTMPPMPGSPAIDAGGPTAFTTDQRGFPRPVGATPDIGAVEGVFNPNFALISPAALGNGAFQFSFVNLAGASFTVFASTNVALPFNAWSNLGQATESLPGTFTFTDPQATTNAQRFYRVKSP